MCFVLEQRSHASLLILAKNAFYCLCPTALVLAFRRESLDSIPRRVYDEDVSI